jgi:hypothetical protein
MLERPYAREIQETSTAQIQLEVSIYMDEGLGLTQTSNMKGLNQKIIAHPLDSLFVLGSYLDLKCTGSRFPSGTVAPR